MFDDPDDLDESDIYKHGSSSWHYRVNKSSDTYDERAANRTADWFKQKSPLERFFYFIALLVFLCLAILIYLLLVQQFNDPFNAGSIYGSINATQERSILGRSNQLPSNKVKSYNQRPLQFSLTTEPTLTRPHIEKPSLCSLIGLNHLAALDPLFNSKNDYYWFKPAPVIESTRIHNPEITQSRFDDLEDLILNRWSINCALNKGSFWCKIKRFWKSCLNQESNNNLDSYRRLMKRVGLMATHGFETKYNLTKLLHEFESHGQTNGLYHYKLLTTSTSDLDNTDEKIFYAGRDNYPHYIGKGLLADQSVIFTKRLDRILGINISNPKMKDVLAFDTMLTNLKGLPRDSRKNYQSGFYRLTRRRDPFEKINKSDYVFEYPDGYIEYLDKNMKQYDLQMYLLCTSYKTNAIHINLQDYKIFFEFFGPFVYPVDRNAFCRDMVKLPFGLIILTQMIDWNGKASSSTVSSEIANNLLESLGSLFDQFTFKDGKLVQMVGHLITSIERFILNDKIQLDDKHLNKLYDELQITENYFDNVQAIRAWLRKGYRQGCLLNFASIP